MKKQFIILLLWCLGSFATGVAQDSISQTSSNLSPNTSNKLNYRKFQIGIIGAPNLIRFKNNIYKRRGEFGYSAGVHAQYNLKKNIGFTLNLLYEEKIGKATLLIFIHIKQNRNASYYIGSGVDIKFLYGSRINNSTHWFKDRNNGNSSSPWSLFYTTNLGIAFPLQKNRSFFI